MIFAKGRQFYSGTIIVSVFIATASLIMICMTSEYAIVVISFKYSSSITEQITSKLNNS